MRMVLQRQTQSQLCTMGEIQIGGAFSAWTLERQGPQFVASYHRAPAGIYKVTLYPSQKFRRIMPLLNDVPGCSDCEIHWGNWPWNSHGCILIGTMKGDNCLYNTREKFAELFPVIEAAVHTEGVDIEILDIPTA
jgi:Family of unknown function (DUF5675)